MLLIKDRPNQFGLISVILHWYIAAVILFFLLPTGLLIYYIGPHGALRPLRADLTWWHMSVALTSLPIFLFYMIWRLIQGKPKTHDQHWALQLAANTTSRVLPLLILWQILTGPTLEALTWFYAEIGRIRLPEFMSVLDDYLGPAHLYGAFVLAAVAALHIAGALKHLLVDRDRVVQSMLRPVAHQRGPAPPPAPGIEPKGNEPVAG